LVVDVAGYSCCWLDFQGLQEAIEAMDHEKKRYTANACDGISIGDSAFNMRIPLPGAIEKVSSKEILYQSNALPVLTRRAYSPHRQDIGPAEVLAQRTGRRTCYGILSRRTLKVAVSWHLYSLMLTQVVQDSEEFYFLQPRRYSGSCFSSLPWL